VNFLKAFDHKADLSPELDAIESSILRNNLIAVMILIKKE
jgi:hypothetical protein